MAKLYWRLKRKGKWTWKPVSETFWKTISNIEGFDFLLLEEEE